MLIVIAVSRCTVYAHFSGSSGHDSGSEPESCYFLPHQDFTNRSMWYDSYQTRTKIYVWTCHDIETGMRNFLDIDGLISFLEEISLFMNVSFCTSFLVGSSPCMPESDCFGRYTVRGGDGNIWSMGVHSGSRVQVSVRWDAGAMAFLDTFKHIIDIWKTPQFEHLLS